MRRVLREFGAIIISLVGAGYILMTVTGSVFKTGVLLTAVAVVAQIGVAFIPEDGDKDEK